MEGAEMTNAPFVAKDLSMEAQTFLYACAFWTVAADEAIKPTEQDWLIAQFGQQGATGSLEHFVALESRDFFAAFDAAARALKPDERKRIFPQLEAWLTSCALSDAGDIEADQAVIQKVLKRLGIVPALAAVASVAAPVGAGSGSGLAVRMLQGHMEEVVLIRVSADGRFVLTGSLEEEARLWDFAAGTEVRNYPGHMMGVTCLCFSSDGRRFFTGDGLGHLRLWDVGSEKPVWTWGMRKSGGLTGVAVSPDGRSVATVTDTGLIRLHTADTGSDRLTINQRRGGALHGVAFDVSGRRLLTGGDDRCVRVWDAQKGAVLAVMEGHSDGILDLCAGPGGRVVSSSRDNSVRVWDMDRAVLVRSLEGHSFSVYGVACSADGNRVASGSWDHSVRVWDTESGRMIWHAESVDSRFSGVAFHPDGNHLLAACSDKAVHVFALTPPDERKGKL
jgi:WD40 repeat protein